MPFPRQNLSIAHRSHRLHSRNLAEMAALQSQLRRIVARRFPEVDLDTPLQQNPDTLTATTLKKALAAGWADQVIKNCATRSCALGIFVGKCLLASG